MGTVAGINTRRYHGLLTASMRPPAERYLLLSRLEELVNNTYISTCQYPGVIAPDGCRTLQAFTRDPFLHWTFRLPEGLIHRELFLVPGQNTVVITYRSEFDGTILIQPMLAFRDYHSVTRKNSRFNSNLQLHSSGFSIHPYDDLPRLHLHVPEAQFTEKPDWYKNLEYLREMDRGLEWHEDLFCPGSFSLHLKAGVESFLVASTEQLEVTPEWCASNKVSRSFATPLEAAADQFLVTRADGKPTIIAGYPWFTD